MKWRTLVFLAAVVVVVLLIVGGVSIGQVYRQSTLQVNNTITPTFFPTVTTHSVIPTPTIQKPKQQITSVMQPPKLYPSIRWEAPKRGRASFITRTGEAIELESYRIESVALNTYPGDFIRYYRQELTASGWEETAVVNGDSHWEFFENNGQYIVFGFHMIFRESVEYVAFVEHN